MFSVRQFEARDGVMFLQTELWQPTGARGWQGRIPRSVVEVWDEHLNSVFLSSNRESQRST